MIINKNIIMSSLRAVETFKRKRVDQTAVSDNQSSSVTLIRSHFAGGVSEQDDMQKGSSKGW